eukprot:CAMPEP_0179050718 /NCGR_PEP_ID=MMETSP0796-20121207/20873_1 /TAXON_ID=73915 /ORGANISM="Pyrodinium bahamense, Strain pbaha01" /LENGTH=94 /DNA_ID=CAMNT_0020747235 /DNA_START=553 /DNA_END=837 /DNA_ORIENTATION=+
MVVIGCGDAATACTAVADGTSPDAGTNVCLVAPLFSSLYLPSAASSAMVISCCATICPAASKLFGLLGVMGGFGQVDSAKAFPRLDIIGARPAY